MQPLDLARFPLQGTALIEASAGTGKTYSIVNLYLRLLLGDGCQPLSVEQILVVTFTNAATAELKSRVGERLQQALRAFVRGHSHDEVLDALLHRLPHGEAVARLQLAQQGLDQAAIFTIHGFAQRVLSQHAFESGSAYGQQFELEQGAWLELAVQDYWRDNLNALQGTELDVVSQYWQTPGDLEAQLRPLLEQPVVFRNLTSLAAARQNLTAYCEQVKAAKCWWLMQGMAEQLAKAKLKANSKVLKRLASMQAFCQSDDLFITFDKAGWALFSPSSIEKAQTKASKGAVPELNSEDFARFAALAELEQHAKQQLLSAYTAHALNAVRGRLADLKREQNLLSPQDLLVDLSIALTGVQADALVRLLRQHYPAALIDEFQDTDALQLQIFSALYAKQEQLCWIMIGDPKQAIYAFRGADIYTYIQAKQQVPASCHYTLETNWRSQADLVDSVNDLFSRQPQVFLTGKEIEFLPVKAAKKRSQLTLNGQRLASLQFAQLVDEGKPISWGQAQAPMANYCAAQIADLLASNNEACIGERPVQAADCCVLVKDRNEAALIKQALQARGVSSVYLARNSVFDSQTAEDLFVILHALADPWQENKVKRALFSQVVALQAPQLDALLLDEWQWQLMQQRFVEWHQRWQQGAVMLVVNLFARHFNLADTLLSTYQDGQRRLTDWRHLLELVQQQARTSSSPAELLSWFELQLQQAKQDQQSQQLRLESDADLVQIITQHASKGLEFPLVFIPFASRYRETTLALYHQHNQLTLDLSQDEESLALAEQQRLAEDIRLLYVAITRGVYRCYIGMWDTTAGRSRKSAWGKTALGHVLGIENADALEAVLAQQQSDIGYCQIDAEQYSTPGEVISVKNANNINGLSVARLSAPVKASWQLTSYSAITRHAVHPEDDLADLPGRDEGQDSADLHRADALATDQEALSPFRFPRGAQPGSFLHEVLENVDFATANGLAEAISQAASKYAIEDKWHPLLNTWLGDVLTTQWFTAAQALSGLSLASCEQARVEMEFLLPLQQLNAEQFNRVLHQYYPERQQHYAFAQLNGMLKGFIDLTFCYQGKYFVADYKSNHLGDSLADYRQEALEFAMQGHDYQLQGILYVLALHRLLRWRLPDYDYNKHIGGACYLFLRGMHSSLPGNGVHFFLPPQRLIEQLDALCAGEQDVV